MFVKCREKLKIAIVVRSVLMQAKFFREHIIKSISNLISYIVTLASQL